MKQGEIQPCELWVTVSKAPRGEGVSVEIP